MDKCPPGTICFSKEIFLILAIAILCLAYYGFRNNNYDTVGSESNVNSINSITSYSTPESDVRLKNIENNLMRQNEKLETIQSTRQETIIYPNLDHQTVHTRELEKIRDPLYGPERKYPYAYSANVMPINISTRARGLEHITSEYQQVGAIYGLNKVNGQHKVLPLYGKPTYPGSHKWLYYTGSDDYHTVKIPISKDGRKCQGDFGCDELYTGDLVNVTPYNCKFKVELYDIDKPKYIPNVF